MKALKYILYSLVILGAGALLAYQGLVEKDLETSDIIKAGLLIAASIVGMVKPSKNKIVNKKAVYQKAYAEHIQGAFEGDEETEKLFYNAIHDYNNNKFSAAMNKLEKLRKECHRSADLRAVAIFTALCLDDMGLYEKAIESYNAALVIRPNSFLYSNMGLCYQRLGNAEASEKCYLQAISLDPENAYAYNNLSAMYFRQADYAQALEFAKKATEIDSNFPQALGCAATCCALLGDEEGYQTFYRRAVSNGYDGRAINAMVQRLRQNINIS